jgi:hypothetical protein
MFLKASATESAPGAESIKAQKALDNINVFLKEPALKPQSKLYGIYLSIGRSEQDARQAVRAHMTAAEGDPEAALRSGLNAAFGIEYQGKTVAQPVERRPLLEEVLDIAIGHPDILLPPEPLKPFEPAAPPPDPRDHSLVVIGGSRVGVINNVTTSGVHIHNAGQSIQNNL